MNRKYLVLRDRECSSMVSTWDELLCVGFGSVKLYKLCLGTFKVLGERAECYDEEVDEYVLPDHINGTPVKGFKDDAVIGYEVESASYRPEDEFEFDNPSECEGWLDEAQWLDDNLLIDLNTALLKLGKPINGIDRPIPKASMF